MALDNRDAYKTLEEIVGPEPFDLFDVDFIRPVNLDRQVVAPEHLDQVVGKGVVVVDD